MRLIAMACMVAASVGLRLPSPQTVTRRSAMAAAAVAVLPAQAAFAEFCFKKCDDPDAERRKAERIAIQTGTYTGSATVAVAAPTVASSQMSGIEGLIDMSIRNEEAATGAPLSDARKAQIAASVRRLAPDEVRAALHIPTCRIAILAELVSLCESPDDIVIPLARAHSPLHVVFRRKWARKSRRASARSEQIGDDRHAMCPSGLRVKGCLSHPFPIFVHLQPHTQRRSRVVRVHVVLEDASGTHV